MSTGPSWPSTGRKRRMIRMIVSRKILGLFLALLSIPALSYETALPGLATAPGQLKLGLGHEYLQLAAANEISTGEETTTESLLYDPEFPNLFIPAEPDKDGLKHDTRLFLLYQVAVVGVLFMMPESISKWSTEDKQGNIFHKWDDNVNNLRKDKDDWGINYIGHPYFGSVYYVRARHRGFDRQDSFLYAAIMSTIYEYGIEALFEPVSIQDLIFTPVGGAIIGEYFMLGRERMKRNISARGYATTSDNILLFLTDPLDAINKKVTNLFGLDDKEDEAHLELAPMLSMGNNSNIGFQLQGVQALYRW